jgi:hypothetical protein
LEKEGAEREEYLLLAIYTLNLSLR